MITKTFTFDGKRYYVRAKTEAEAIKKMALKQRDLEEGKTVISGNMTVREWANKAVDVYKTNQAEITRQKYIQRMNHCILEEIGSMQIKAVKSVHCQNVMNIQIGNSKTQINEVFQTLKFIFRTAKENNLIILDPAEHIVKPQGTKGKRRSITDKERHYLLEVCENPKYTIFLLMLYCGCRPSEAREVMGKDIKLLEGVPVLHIRGTKTANADRTVPIPLEFYEKIKGTPKMEYLSQTEEGNKHYQKSYYRLCKHLYRDLNIAMGCKMYRNQLIPPYPLADDFVPYNLRHTYCTDLQKKGIDIRTAQYLMGHADIQMTANIYTHADTSTILQASTLINNSATLGATPKRYNSL